MKSPFRTGILIITLVVPVLVFIFLKIYGKNHYSLPVYFAQDSTQVSGKYQITSAHQIPNFSLVNQENKEVSLNDFKGNILVVDFFFTQCQSICPKMTSQLTRVQEEFKHDENLKILSFSVDPEADSPEVLKEYAKKFEADETKWSFITGKKDSIYNLAQKGFFLSAMEDSERPLEFIHSEKLVLVDKNGWIRGYYDGTDKEEVDRLITEIKILKEIYASK